ncbi:MAG TPA: biopolymer transporter ExbD [Candidatus Acidoferrum sp.]
MAQKTLATIGLIVLVTAIFVSWGTNHWIQTRTFNPVDMPVSLEHGPIRTREFGINLRETYWMSIQIDDSADDHYDDGRCSSKNLGGNHWRVFRIHSGSERELWARRDDSNDFYWLNAFDGVPGRYEVEWDVPVGAGCLKARHPRFSVSTSSRAYLEFDSLIEYPCLFLGGTGVMLLLRSFIPWLLSIFVPKQELRIFPELVLRNLIDRRRHLATPPIRDLSNFGIVWGSILYVLMFIFATATPVRSHGLFVGLKQPRSAAAQPSPWPETTSVYIGPLQFYVNGKPIERNELRVKLAEALSKQMVWTVYLEAHPDCTFGEAVYAMDTIQGIGAKVVWITPKTREALTGGVSPKK